MKTNGTPPVFERRLGSIRVAVFENPSETGLWWTASLVRRYKDKDSDEWRDANNFNGLQDLAVVQEAVGLAQQFIRERIGALQVEG
jgi:hypothetical protein